MKRPNTMHVSIAIALSHQISAFTVSPSVSSNSNLSSRIFSSPQDNNQDESLILRGLSSLGSEAGYLEAARKRNEVAKAKLKEQLRLEEEETERKRQEKLQRGTAHANYGPGDLSNFKGFANDGFEASAGNDEVGGWSQEAIREEKGNEDKQEEPKLFLFGDDGNLSTDSGGLLL